jgi:nucleoid-associated protein YgaU
MFVRTSTTALLLALLVVVFALATARPSRGAGAETRYVVRSGDTLWEIAAARYAGDPRKAVWRISQRNGLDGGALTPGTVLYLPQ